MAVLENTQYETYAQGIAAGKTKRKACIDAGYSESSAGTQSTKLSKRPEIIERIKELREEIANADIMEVEEILKRLSNIAKDESIHIKYRLTALRYAGEAKGAFIQKIEHNVTPPVILPYIIDDKREE